jgi:peptidoglycan hydrolase-like protein with peptidoglycan-binding domain
MKRIRGPEALRISLVAALLAAAAVPAAAQLEIGGQPFESNDAASADAAPATGGDDLTRRIQRDLVALGYEPGSISGEMNVDTAVAISRFQAENGLEVSGEATPQLAGILAARVGAMRDGGQAQAEPGAASVPTSGAASADCVPRAAEAADTSRNAGRLARAGGRLFSRFGGDRAKEQVADATRTATDVAEVADVVSDLAECEPGG